MHHFARTAAHPLPAVPCLRRAAAVEEYGAREEQEVEADEGGEGWVTASQAAPGAATAGATTTNEDGFEEIPSVDDAAGGSSGAGAGGAAAAGEGGAEEGAEEEEEEDVPDIADLDLEEEEDEVGAVLLGWASRWSGSAAGLLMVQDSAVCPLWWPAVSLPLCSPISC